VSEDLTSKSVTELASQIRSRAISAVEVVEAHLKRIEQINPSLNAIVTVAPDLLDRAHAADKSLSDGNSVGPLHGVPLTIKDTIDTKGLRTTYGSRLRQRHVPDTDASVVERLRAAGAIILGKTNTPEMAIPYETDNPVFGRTNNPHDLSRTPGGSSGGEAAAIAAHLSPAGIGSDLSGSIRVPAHFCGITGLKPTTGRVPMDGHVPQAIGPLSLGACIGPMARHACDLELLFGVLANLPVLEIPESEFADKAQRELRGFQLAAYTDDGSTPVGDDTVAAVQSAARALAAAGLEVREERPPSVSEGSRLWIELFSRAATEQLREFYRGREAEAGAGVASILSQPRADATLENKIHVAEKVARAVVERERLRERLLSWMKSTPLILGPVGATPAFEHGSERIQIHDQTISTFRAFTYSQTFNLFGLPAVSVPAGHSAAGLPIGVQIVGRPFEDHTVMAAAAILEQSFAGFA
jgi:Asp-tRNA(Asn)/Glu-tRNA(Gln) amidotransferase A subunit family amidase